MKSFRGNDDRSSSKDDSKRLFSNFNELLVVKNPSLF